jgi:hypothetical protein
LKVWLDWALAREYVDIETYPISFPEPAILGKDARLWDNPLPEARNPG